MDSLATVLSQELAKFNRLLKELVVSLVELQKAIRGQVVMSSALDKMYTAFMLNRVPPNWVSVGFASLKPLASWVTDMQGRVAFLRNWLENGEPHAFPVPVFFFPQGFLTGVLQNHSRKYMIPINTIDFVFEVLQGTAEDLADPPEDGVHCHGLYMEGARWDAEDAVISDSLPGQMYAPMAPVHFIPQADVLPDPEMYSCPCYKTSLRQGVLSTTGISTNFVIAVQLPTKMAPSAWVLRGAAFLCNLND
jgi:dynein heavy chain